MPGGKQAFTEKHSDIAEKVNRDPSISPGDLVEFWDEVEKHSDPNSIESHFQDCCASRQFHGPSVVLEEAECLGSAQPFVSIVAELSTQILPNTNIPPSEEGDVISGLHSVLVGADQDAALKSFIEEFGDYRIRWRNTEVNLRIFAFRGQGRNSDPTDGLGAHDLFTRLDIPNASPDDYILIIYRVVPNDKIHQPTCFDAITIDNLKKFMTGGKTISGIDEVVSTPPLCKNLTRAPRNVS